MNRENFEKVLRKKTVGITGIILIIIGVLTGLGGYFLCQNSEKNLKSLHEHILKEGAGQLDYTYIDVDTMSEAFATLDGKLAYLLFDKEYPYIAALDVDNQEALKDILAYSYGEIENKPESARIKGMTTYISEDLKNLAIEYYNEIFEEEVLNSANFETYLGNVFLDTYENPFSSYGIFFFSLSIGMIVMGMIEIIVYFVHNKKNKTQLEKYENELDKIYTDLDKTTSQYYKGQKLFLTDQHLISFLKGLEIMNYKNIVWVYPQDHYVNGILTNRAILIMDDNFKIHNIAITGFGKKQKIVFDEIYNNITVNASDALKGYSKENKEIIKQRKLER